MSRLSSSLTLHEAVTRALADHVRLTVPEVARRIRFHDDDVDVGAHFAELLQAEDGSRTAAEIADNLIRGAIGAYLMEKG